MTTMHSTKNLLDEHPSDWRRWLLNPVVPEGEGEQKPLSIGIPEKMLESLDQIAEETSNTRADAVRHLLRWAISAYRKGRAVEEEQTNLVKRGKKAS